MKNKSFLTMSALISMTLCSNAYSESALVAEPQIPQVISESNLQQNSYSLLRARWASYFLGDSAFEFDQKLQNEVTKVNQQSNTSLTNLVIQKQGLWDDLLLNDDNKLGVQLYATYQRLFTLARAYKLPGGELENNPLLIEKLIQSLTFLHDNFYHVGTPERGNWWQWQLGIGSVLNDTLIILHDDLPQDLINNYVETSRYFVPRPTHLSEGFGAPYSSAPLMFKSTGGNRTDNAKIVLIRGILAKDSDEISSAVTALSSIIPLITEGDGFYKDGSFIQHKDLPYSGTYGQVMVQGLGLLMGLVADTQWQITDPELQKIYPILLQSFAPLMVNGKVMDMVNGRAISRISGQDYIIGQSMLSAMMLYLPGAPDSYKIQLAEFLKSQLISQKNEGLKPSVILSSYQLSQQLIKDKTVAAQSPRSIHKQFSEMDRVVHHRPTWSLGIAMHSNRVGNYECINGENLKGWNTADGMTYLYNAQSNDFSEFWPLVDAYKLPGTTILQMERTPCEGQLSAQRNGRQRSMNWTGGAQLAEYGIAGMKFVNWNGNLSAKKSWFMFDNEVIALGSDIKNDTKHPSITTIENRKVSANSHVFVNGNKLTDNNDIEQPLTNMTIQYNTEQPAISYYSLDQQPVKISLQCRSGNWSDIGNDVGKIEGCFVEATIEHSSNHIGNYGYVIVPRDMSDKSATQPITVVKNNANVHAIEQTELGIFAANFWDDASAGIVTSSSPMSIMLKTEGEIMQVSVSNPTRSWWNTKFELEGQYSLLTNESNRVTLKEGNKLSIKLSDMDGASYSFKLKIQKSISENK